MPKQEIKLTPNQVKVIKLMREGWALGKWRYFGGRAWLQKGGLGECGECVNVNLHTWSALLDREIIYQSFISAGSSTFKLTELGKNIGL